MTRSKKRKEELELATSFQGHMPDLAGHVLTTAAPPEPDIIAASPDRTIGIEVTHMRGLPLLSLRESERSLVVQRAQQIVHQRTNSHTAVRVDWSAGIQFTKHNRASLAEQLAQFVETNLPANECEVVFGPPFVAPSMPNDPAFAYVYILRVDSAGESDWDGMDGWSGSKADPAFVQAHIDRKSAKPSKYKTRYAQRWLLLIHEGYKPSSGYDLVDSVRTSTFRSTYDRVFIYSLTPGAVTELVLSAPAQVI